MKIYVFLVFLGGGGPLLLAGVSTIISTCIDTPVGFLTIPHILMFLSVTNSHMYTMQRRGLIALEFIIREWSGGREEAIPPNVIAAEVPLRNLVVCYLAITRIVTVFRDHQGSLLMRPLIYKKTTIIRGICISHIKRTEELE